MFARRSNKDKQQAQRFEPQISFSLLISPSHSPRHQIRFWLSLPQLQYFLGLFMVLNVIFFSATLLYHQILPQIQSYDEALRINQLQKETIFKLLGENKSLQELSTQLFEEDHFLREKLFLNQRNKVMTKESPIPTIAVNHYNEADGEIAEIIVDDRLIMKLVDHSANPMAVSRATQFAENIRKVYLNRSPANRFNFQGNQHNYFQVYYNREKVFDVTEMDADYFNTTPRQLTKKWIDDLSVSLGLKTEPLWQMQVRNFFQNFRQIHKFEPLYTDIDYVSGKKILSEYTTQPEIHKIDQLVAFLNQELQKRTDSYNSLRNVIREYKNRFAKTPSMSPIQSVSISGFGRRIHPITGRITFHAGVDLPAPEGTPVRATADGVVSRAGWLGGYGRAVEIQHGYGLSTLYAHNSSLGVNVGQSVVKGQVISYCGRSGFAVGTHVHYEVRLWNRPINPVRFLNLDIFTASRSW